MLGVASTAVLQERRRMPVGRKREAKRSVEARMAKRWPKNVYQGAGAV